MGNLMHDRGSGCSCVTLQDGDDDAPGDQVWWLADCSAQQVIAQTSIPYRSTEQFFLQSAFSPFDSA